MNQESHMESFSDKRILVMIGVIALIVRGVVCFWNPDRFSSDPDAYRAIAETISQSGVFGLTDENGDPKPTAFRPPLYPFILSWLCKDGELSSYSVGLLHTILGALTVVLVYQIARQVISSRSRLPPIVASILVMIDPILLQQSTIVMTETLAVALTVLGIWIWSLQRAKGFQWSYCLTLGITLSLAFLCRPTFLVWAALLIAAISLWKSEPKQSWMNRIASAATVGLVMIVTVGAWTYRNHVVMGHPIWATSHGGYTLLLGNNPSFYKYLDDGQFGTAWDAEPFLEAYRHRYDGDPTQESFWNQDWSNIDPTYPSVSEKEDDQVSYEAAVATIKRQPGMFVWSCFVRAGRLWSPLPHRTATRSWVSVIPVAAYYFLFYAAVAIALFRFPTKWLRRECWAILAMVVTLSGVHAVYWSNLRMRAPAIPGLAIVAASVLVRRCDDPDQ